MAFLCTRVSTPTHQDWAKLNEFLNGTLEVVLTLGVESLEELLNFVDVSNAVYPNMRSHTGGGVTFGRRMNTTSTTELKVVGGS